jgi:hypothetical protein
MPALPGPWPHVRAPSRRVPRSMLAWEAGSANRWGRGKARALVEETVESWGGHSGLDWARKLEAEQEATTVRW